MNMNMKEIYTRTALRLAVRLLTIRRTPDLWNTLQLRLRSIMYYHLVAWVAEHKKQWATGRLIIIIYLAWRWYQVATAAYDARGLATGTASTRRQVRPSCYHSPGPQRRRGMRHCRCIYYVPENTRTSNTHTHGLHCRVRRTASSMGTTMGKEPNSNTHTHTHTHTHTTAGLSGSPLFSSSIFSGIAPRWVIGTSFYVLFDTQPTLSLYWRKHRAVIPACELASSILIHHATGILAERRCSIYSLHQLPTPVQSEDIKLINSVKYRRPQRYYADRVRPSVSLSVPSAHIRRDSPGGSTRPANEHFSPSITWTGILILRGKSVWGCMHAWVQSVDILNSNSKLKLLAWLKTCREMTFII